MTLLDAWVDRLKGSAAEDAELRTLLEGWLELLGPALDQDEWSQGELLKLLSIYARGLGAKGKPSSMALKIVLCLEDALAESKPMALWRPLTRLMLSVVSDSHALGQTQRLQEQHLKTLQRGAPVLTLGDLVLGFLIGPMEPELLDALFGRVLRVRSASGARLALVDCMGAEQDDDRFHRTVQGFLKSEAWQAAPGRLGLSGLVSIERTQKALLSLGCDPAQLIFYENIQQALGDLYRA